MDDRILYNPDNRFLASSGSNDFSLYGAPADPAMWFARAAAPSAPGEAEHSPRAADAPAGPGAGQTVAPLAPSSPTPAPPDGTGSGSAAQSILLAAGSAGVVTPAAEAPTSLAPFVAAFAAPPAVDRAESAPPQPPAPASVAAETVPAFADAPAGTIQAASAAAPAAGLAAEAKDGIGPAVTGPLSELVPAGTSGLEDGVTDLLGSDPAGGIATLVSLVTISEVLDLQPSGGEGGDPIIASGIAVIDTLAADALGETAPPDTEAEAEDPIAGIITVPLPLPDDGLPGGLG